MIVPLGAHRTGSCRTGARCHPWLADTLRVLLPLPEPSDVLLVSRDRDRTETLRSALTEQGHVVEIARGHRSALQAFFDAGGHDWVFLGADLPLDEAEALTAGLRAVEARVRVL